MTRNDRRFLKLIDCPEIQKWELGKYVCKVCGNSTMFWDNKEKKYCCYKHHYSVVSKPTLTDLMEIAGKVTGEKNWVWLMTGFWSWLVDKCGQDPNSFTLLASSDFPTPEIAWATYVIELQRRGK